jgi:hypothetical protein
VRTAGDKPWEIVLHPERDEILACDQLKRPVMCVYTHPHAGDCSQECIGMPYDSSVAILTMEQAQKHAGTWRFEIWAPSEFDARRVAHEAMRKRRAVTLLEPR